MYGKKSNCFIGGVVYMKKQINIFIALIIILLICSSCGASSHNNSMFHTNVAGAYVTLFEHKTSPSTDGWLQSLKYIAFDLSNVLYDDPDRIQNELENYLEDYHFILLWDDIDGLVERGYITTDELGLPGSFTDGVLFFFGDVELSKNKLITNAGIWYGNLGGSGATYTLIAERGEWIVKAIEKEWIS